MRLVDISIPEELLEASKELLERERGPSAGMPRALAWQAPRRIPGKRRPPMRLRSQEDLFGEVLWSPPSRRNPGPERRAPSAEAEIDALYAEVRRLARAAEVDPRAEAVYQRALARLRALQHQEAEVWRARLRARCELPPGEGRAALRRADELIAKYAHLAPADRAAEDPARETSSTESVE